jgi:hypothetical protein
MANASNKRSWSTNLVTTLCGICVVAILAGVISQTQADSDDVLVIARNPSPKDRDSKDADKTGELKRVAMTSGNAMIAEASRIVTSLEKHSATLREYQNNRRQIHEYSSMLIAISRAALHSKDQTLAKERPRFMELVIRSEPLAKQPGPRTREGWLRTQKMVSDLRTTLNAKHGELVGDHKLPPLNPDKLYFGTMKRFMHWYKWSMDSVTNETAMQEHSLRAEREARVVDLLAQSIKTLQPNEDDFAGHADALGKAAASTAQAAFGNDLNLYRETISAASKKCTQCHSEFRN